MEWKFYYILDKTGNPVAVKDIIEWATWFSVANRHVGLDFIGEARISTVFLGMNHNWGEGRPILWETMIFNDKKFEDFQKRCAGSREQAEAMHQEAVEMVKKVYEQLKTDDQKS